MLKRDIQYLQKEERRYSPAEGRNFSLLFVEAVYHAERMVKKTSGVQIFLHAGFCSYIFLCFQPREHASSTRCVFSACGSRSLYFLLRIFPPVSRCSKMVQSTSYSVAVSMIAAKRKIILFFSFSEIYKADD